MIHQDPSGPGVAFEKSTIPEKSGSSGSCRGENGKSGSGTGSGEGRGDGLAQTEATIDNNPTYINDKINHTHCTINK